MTSFPLIEKYVETGRSKVAYYMTSPIKSQPTIIFLHGLSSNHTTWLNMLPAFEAAGYNCIALDIRGHGKSDKKRRRLNYKLKVMVDDLKKVIDNEYLDRVILVGYSYGGMIALDFAIQYPDLTEKLILVSTNFRNPFIYWRIGPLTIPARWGVILLGYLLIWQKRKNYYYYSHGATHNYWDAWWVGLNTMPLSINLWMLAETVTFDHAKDIAKVTAPILVVRAAGDHILTARELDDIRHIMPSIQVVEPKHPSHFIASRSQDELSEIILKFLKS